MEIITLEHKVILDNETVADYAELIKNTYRMLESPFRYMSSRGLKTWEEFRRSVPDDYKDVKRIINEIAKPYVNLYKYQIEDVSGRHRIKFDSFEVEVFETDLNSADKHTLVIYLRSQQFKLINTFGRYLLLCDKNNSEVSEYQTLMIELNPSLTISSYKSDSI